MFHGSKIKHAEGQSDLYIKRSFHALWPRNAYKLINIRVNVWKAAANHHISLTLSAGWVCQATCCILNHASNSH
jgi:hypothetical protein